MLLHQYYDWQLVERLPLRCFGELLTAARKRDEQEEKEKTDKLMLGLWIVRFAVDCIRGEEPIGLEEFMAVDDEKPKRCADDIMADILPIIDAERRRNGGS